MATFYNQATLSYNGINTTSNITTGEILEVLSVDKNAVDNNYTPGASITYSISILNSGTTPFTNLTVSDNLGAYTYNTQTVVPLTYVDGTVQYYIDGVLQPAPTVTAGPPINFTGISVPSGGNALIIYEAIANEYAPLGNLQRIVNEVTVSGDGVATPITAAENVTASTDPVLSISKTLNPIAVSENSQITYTFTVENTGSTEALSTDNAVITDTFTPPLSSLSVTFNGTPWVENTNYTYNASTGEFATIPGQITVPAATYSQDTATGTWSTNPGTSTLVISGTI